MIWNRESGKRRDRRGTPKARDSERLTDNVYETLRREANDVLQAFTASDGTAEMPVEGHLVAAYPSGPDRLTRTRFGDLMPA